MEPNVKHTAMIDIPTFLVVMGFFAIIIISM